MIEFFTENTDFLLGIYSGLAASILFYILGRLLKYIKAHLLSKGFINVLLKSKILYVFDNQKEAENQIYKDAQKSKKIFAFVTRSSLFSETVDNRFYELLLNENNELDGKFLFSNPESQYALDREIELNRPVVEQLRASIAVMDKIAKKNNKVKFSLHDESMRLKFFIFDDVIYLFFKVKGKASPESQVFRIGHNSIIYKTLAEQFGDFWDKYYKSDSENAE